MIIELGKENARRTNRPMFMGPQERGAGTSFAVMHVNIQFDFGCSGEEGSRGWERVGREGLWL